MKFNDMSHSGSMTTEMRKSNSAAPIATRVSAGDGSPGGGISSRKDEILDAARTLLITEGYSNFSLRAIAAQVGVSLRTVQHHFKSKDNLMKAVLWDTVSGYDELPQKSLNGAQNGPRIAFIKNLQSMLADTHDEETAGFFYQLWSYAYYRREGADICNAVYAEHVHRISKMMQPLNPGSSAKKRKQRAVVVAALIDGMMVVNGYGRKPIADAAGIEKEVISTALRLATEA